MFKVLGWRFPYWVLKCLCPVLWFTNLEGCFELWVMRPSVNKRLTVWLGRRGILRLW